mmetsp:Transcript_24971/g.59360  ORF Transcript_24971/g.59360 Transcript_24971/m.59360 type:complete len:370 (-) Transcript_24971:690-1799(-)
MWSSLQTPSFPYGIVIVTVAYLVVVLITVYTVDIECLQEPCNSEGIDNSVLGFVTDFWISLCFFLFGIHLKWFVSPSKVDPAAWRAQWWMGIAFCLGGVGHGFFANSGTDDNAGMLGYYIIWAVSFVVLALSVFSVYRFVQNLQRRYKHYLDNGSSTTSSSAATTTTTTRWTRFLKVSFALILISTIVVVGGNIWCASQPSLHVDGVIDTVPPIDNEDGDDEESTTTNACLVMGFYGEVVWYVSFALFWIPVAAICRRVILAQSSSETDGNGNDNSNDNSNNDNNANDQPRLVYGFLNSWAALWIGIIPCTFGIMLIVWAGVVALILGQEATDVYETIYGAVVYHYGMLLSLFFFHNVAYSLPCEEAKN